MTRQFDRLPEQPPSENPPKFLTRMYTYGDPVPNHQIQIRLYVRDGNLGSNCQI